ncbi:MAG: carbon storage regulator [Planctomycetales bacterium]|nr:carbon storage regulator [Planctomycetales bacterium]
MLVLTRKQNEQIRIGDDIVITIVRTKGKAVRVGIQAPEHLSILRGELVFDVEESHEDDVADTTAGPAEKIRRPALSIADNAYRGREHGWESDAENVVAAGCGTTTSLATRPLAEVMRRAKR